MVTKVIQVRLASNKEDLKWLLKDAGQKKKDIKQALITGGMSDTQWDKKTGSPLQVMVAMMSGVFSEETDLACLKDVIQNEVVLFWMGHNYCLPVSDTDVLGYAKKIIDKATKEYKAMIASGGEYAIITFDPEGGLIECRSDRSSEMAWDMGPEQMTLNEKSLLMWGDVADEVEIYHKYGIQHGKHEPLETLRKEAEAKKFAESERWKNIEKNGWKIVGPDGVVYESKASPTVQAWPAGNVVKVSKTDVTSIPLTITWNLGKKDEK